MTTIFCVRPATPNVGNAVIYQAVSEQLRAAFGPDTSVVGIPALPVGGVGGLTAAQIYDMNRIADGVLIGGGNLFENGQIVIDTSALAALTTPMLVSGISHGRIYNDAGALVARTDSIPPGALHQLCRQAVAVLVRDAGSRRLLLEMGIDKAQLGGCPTLFMGAPSQGVATTGRVLVSVRHPSRMSVPPVLQWRMASDLRRLIDALRARYGDRVTLVCHDYKDLEFARAFADTPLAYYEDVDAYLSALAACQLNVTYRLHAFLPCLNFAVPSIHISYDERGREMLNSVGMGAWDVDLLTESDVVSAVMARAAATERYADLRREAAPLLAAMEAASDAAMANFVRAVGERTKQRAAGA